MRKLFEWTRNLSPATQEVLSVVTWLAVAALVLGLLLTVSEIV